MPTPSIESMFDIQRIHNQDFLKVLLYFPVGFILLLLRLTVILFSWPFLAFLPKASTLRSILLRAVCLSFGIFVKKEDIHFLNERVKLLVCNHISILDHVAVESVLSCKQVNICSHFFAEWDFPIHSSDRNTGDGGVSREMLNLLQEYINASNTSAALIFPEGDTTNGKQGLLKFIEAPFGLISSVQPVVIQIPHTSFINIAPSVIGANDWCELLWLLFVPYTVYTLRVLPIVSQMETESAEHFCKRVQDIMASTLNLTSTEYTSDNKAELERNLNISSPPARSDVQPRHISRLNRMAAQVKEVLPDVPTDVIIRDLKVTKSIDDTIFRIIEGVVQYVPENNPSTSSPSTSSNGNERSPRKTTIVPPLTAAAEKFGKTAGDRMQSYQERKAAFFKAAKLRYLQKHPELIEQI